MRPQWFPKSLDDMNHEILVGSGQDPYLMAYEIIPT